MNLPSIDPINANSALSPNDVSFSDELDLAESESALIENAMIEYMMMSYAMDTFASPVSTDAILGDLLNSN